jgi:hypothetical protein
VESECIVLEFTNTVVCGDGYLTIHLHPQHDTPVEATTYKLTSVGLQGRFIDRRENEL